MADVTLPNPLEALENLIIHGFNSFFDVRYSALSAAMLGFWEYAITFDQEVELVWKSPWTKGKILFLAIRYYSIAAAIDAHLFEGKFWVIWQGGLNGLIVNVAIAQGILVMRVRALYNNSRTINIILYGSLLLTMGATASIMGYAIGTAPIAVLEFPPYVTCTIGTVPMYLSTYFIPIFMLETLLAGLAVYKWLKDVGMRVTSPWQGFGPKLLYVLVRDSVLYFFAMSALYTFNIILWRTNPDLFEVPVVFIFAAASLLGQRLILNMRARTIRGTALDSVGGSLGGSAVRNVVLNSSGSTEVVTFLPVQSQGLVEVMEETEKRAVSAPTRVAFSPVPNQGLVEEMEDTREGAFPTHYQTRHRSIRRLPPTPSYSPWHSDVEAGTSPSSA
ncbi:hypothetical protein FA95DRAFT_1557145 [Auriscalpium vulgare]|uniref:Uncharacterized protein n=1 Tax=Auriscalpium vulgare TaxID=40419 RepID=A0ACB8RZ83_9AGAM|nr:hypothetical protein FA95DRAFT_1557145 [Auriscalpium vulgare]